jgi:D-xylose reductase
VLRWHVQRNTIPIPKTTKVERLIENISVFDFALTEDEMNGISALNKNIRYNDPGVFAEPAFGCFSPIYD